MKKKTKHSTLSNNLYILKQIHIASRGRIFFELSSIILNTVSNILLDVYMFKYIINGIQKGLDFKRLVGFILIITAFHIFTATVVDYFWEKFAPVSNQKICSHIQKNLFEKASSVEFACFEDPDFYDKYVKAISEAYNRTNEVLRSLCDIVYFIFNAFATAFIIFTIDPVLIVFVLIPFIVSILFGKRLNKVRYNYTMEMQEKSRKRDYVKRVFYLADYAKEMRLTNINRVMFKKFYEAIKELKGVIKKHGLKVALLDYLFIAVNDIIVYLGAILYSAYKTLVSKTMLYGDCVVVINGINNVAWSLRNMADVFIQFQNHSLYIDNLRYFLEYKPAIYENREGLDPPDTCTLTLKNVSFKYAGQEDYSLKNINFTIKQGEKIALVGHNGAGKTTLVKLLMRLYDVTEGEIQLNGRPIKEYKLKGYRNLFSVVFQDFKVFAVSVLENILLKADITKKEKNRAVSGIKDAGIYDKVMSLEKGYETVLTKEFDENGAVLSGGEAQKVAISRVFAKDCEIVILDEPSSALDPMTEYELNNTLMTALDKTVIIISHRLSTTRVADIIYMLENGEIIEQGSHKELMQTGGKYAEMFLKQAEKYNF